MTTPPPEASPTPPAAGRPAVCPKCGAPVVGDSNFCENCGSPLTAAAEAAPTPTDPANPGSPLAAAAQAEAAAAPGALHTETAPLDLGSGPISRPTNITRPAGAEAAAAAPTSYGPCVNCGGVVGDDGYCETCGTKAQTPRDHFRLRPAPWVAGVCDRGIRHHRNEDAMSLVATPDVHALDRRAVLAVLDGVSNTDDSQIGSLAGATAAMGVLQTPFPQGMGTAASRTAAATQVMAHAAEAAQAEVVKAAPADAANPASATFCIVVLEGSHVTWANIGDSRSYWLPDASPGRQLSTDDSAAEQQIASGIAREVAESSPQAHAITKWLGRDAPDIVPTVGELDLTEPGWLLVCSDGLWNYASDPEQMKAQLAAAATADPAAATDPAVLALALVQFANDSGGQDNITATLARVDPAVPTGVAAPAAAPADALPPPSPSPQTGQNAVTAPASPPEGS